MRWCGGCKLGRHARRRLADPRTTVLATVVSIWELTIKHRARKLKQPGSALLPIIAEERITLIDVRLPHLLALEELGTYHSDPYDHLILAQAKAEGAMLMTHDEDMLLYGVPCIGTD